MLNKVWMGIIGVLVLVSACFGLVNQIQRAAFKAGYAARSLEIETASNDRLQAAIEELSKLQREADLNDDAIQNFKGDNPPVGARTQLVFDRMRKQYANGAAERSN